MSEQVTEIPQVQSVQQIPVDPKKKSGFKIIVILLIVISLIAIGGVVFGMQIEKRKVKVWTEPPLTEVTPQPKNNTPQVITETITFKPTGTVDETAGWKIYKSEKYGFEFKYPNNWSINEVPSDGNLEIIPPIKNDKQEGEIVFLVIPSAGVSVETYLNENNPITEGKNSDVYKVEKEFVVNNSKVFFARGGCCGWFGKHALVENKNGEYSLDVILRDTDISQPIINEDIFDQILSTFKFTNSSN